MATNKPPGPPPFDPFAQRDGRTEPPRLTEDPRRPASGQPGAPYGANPAAPRQSRPQTQPPGYGSPPPQRGQQPTYAHQSPPGGPRGQPPPLPPRGPVTAPNQQGFGGAGYGGGGRPPQRPPAQPMRSGPPGGTRPTKGFGVLKGLAFFAMTLVVIAGGTAAYLILNAPADLVRDRIIAEIKANTGRTLTVAGPATFTLYPNIGVAMEGVSLSPPPGMTGKPLVTMDSLDVSVRILPLLKREVYVERIILKKPVFELYSDATGRNSWTFAANQAPTPLRFAEATPPASTPHATLSDAPAANVAAAGNSNPQLQQLHFGNVSIDDGTVRYADASGRQKEASAINMKVAMSDVREPLSANGDLVWNNQKVGLDLSLTSLADLMDSKPARVAVQLASAPANAEFDGSVSVRDSYDIEGTLTTKAPSLRALARWFGTELPRAKGYGVLDATGQVRATDKLISLSGAAITLDEAKATGQVTVETQGQRPYVKTTLAITELDLNKYLGPATRSARDPDAPAKAGAGKPAAGGPSSIDELLNESSPAPTAPATGPRVQGFTQRAGWSTDPIDLSAFDALDADAKLSVGRLLYQDIKVGQSQLTVTLKNKVLKANFDDVQLYGGRGTGFVSLDAGGAKSVGIGANLSIDAIDALPFLTDAAGIDKLAGRAKLSLAVAAQGTNQQQMMNTLNGKGDFTFANGAVIGLNVAGMVRGISQGKLGGLKAAPSEKTDFSELSSTWTIVNGVATNQDLRLVSPLMRLSGGGTVTLGNQTADYVMRPKLVSSLAGQGGTGNEQGLEVPVRVHGPWSDLDYTPDLKGILSDPNKTVEALKEIGKQFKGQNAGEALKSLFGKGQASNGSAGTGDAQQKPTGKQLLDQFLKSQ